MTSSTSDDNSILLVHAYLDGELDPANALEIEQRMSNDPALAAEGERVKALRQLIHERLPPEVVATRFAFPHRGIGRRSSTCTGATVVARACRIYRSDGRGRQ